MQIEETREFLDSNISQIMDGLPSKTVCPIYFKIDKEDNKFESNGSGCCIKFNSKFYFITAAHCLFEGSQRISDKCWIYSDKSKQVILLENTNVFLELYVGNLNNQDEDEDVAIFEIVSTEDYFDYFEVDRTQNLAMSNLNGQIYYGVALGFPSNKNQSKHVFRKHGEYLKSHGSIHELDDITVKELNISIDKNLVLDSGKYTYTEQGTHGNFNNPKGMSGGALFTFNNNDIPLASLISNNTLSVLPKLSGLLIEHQKIKGKNQFFIAISIGVILEKIEEINVQAA